MTGRVKGTVRDDYAVTVFLASSRSGSVSVYRSQCSCPVAMDCKHAAAVLIVARHLVAGPAVDRPEWERMLDKLLEAEPPYFPPMWPRWRWNSEWNGYPRSGDTSGRQDLRIRPARAPQRRLGALGDLMGRPPIRCPLVRCRHGSYCSSSRGSRRERPLCLAAHRLAFTWHGQQCFLGVARPGGHRGLTILAVKPLLGPIRTTAGVGDRGRAPGSSVGVSSVPGSCLMIGSWTVVGRRPRRAGPGVFHVAEEAGRRTGADRGAAGTTAEPGMRQLVVDPHSLLIPSEDEARFLTDFIPRLRQKMTITSADRSVRLPDYVEPTVGVVVHFRPEHRVRLDWMVHYDGA